MACSKASTSVIDHIIYLCGFPDDSNMVKFIRNKGWIDLSDVTTLSLDDTNDFETVSYKDQPLAHHVRKFRGFLLYYLRKCHELSFDLDKDDIIMITKKEFTSYCGSLDYHSDMHLSGYKKRAPKLVVFETESAATFVGEHSNKHSDYKVFIQSNLGTTKYVKDTSKFDDATKGKDYEATGMSQLMVYNKFGDNGKGGIAPVIYKWTHRHMIYDVKHDGWHKSFIVAGGRKTVGNPLELWGADAGKDYPKYKMKMKGCIICGPEFGTHNALSYVNLTSEVDWDPGSYHNMVDDIYKFYGVKEVDNIREWGAMEKLISDWDDGEDHEMMNE
jgi:hypothetical protein